MINVPAEVTALVVILANAANLRIVVNGKSNFSVSKPVINNLDASEPLE